MSVSATGIHVLRQISKPDNLTISGTRVWTQRIDPRFPFAWFSVHSRFNPWRRVHGIVPAFIASRDFGATFRVTDANEDFQRRAWSKCRHPDLGSADVARARFDGTNQRQPDRSFAGDRECSGCSGGGDLERTGAAPGTIWIRHDSPRPRGNLAAAAVDGRGHRGRIRTIGIPSAGDDDLLPLQTRRRRTHARLGRASR